MRNVEIRLQKRQQKMSKLLRTLYTRQILHNHPIAVDYAWSSSSCVKNAKQGSRIV